MWYNRGMKIEKISSKTAIDFLLPRHYSGRKPPISFAFGWYDGDNLVAVCTFGKPVSPYLCSHICGEEYKDKVYELNRLYKLDSCEKQISEFVAGCLRILSASDLIIVSYSDMGMKHHGYIYQACNFLYTGETKKRTDKWTEGNKHSRHYDNEKQNGIRKVRTPKHRYVYFATKNKKLKKLYMEKLSYGVKPYPKGDNNTYEEGNFLEPEYI